MVLRSKIDPQEHRQRGDLQGVGRCLLPPYRRGYRCLKRRDQTNRAGIQATALHPEAKSPRRAPAFMCPVRGAGAWPSPRKDNVSRITSSCGPQQRRSSKPRPVSPRHACAAKRRQRSTVKDMIADRSAIFGAGKAAAPTPKRSTPFQPLQRHQDISDQGFRSPPAMAGSRGHATGLTSRGALVILIMDSSYPLSGSSGFHG